MANEEHLYILEEGAEVWNTWRKENPNIEPDLQGADPSLHDFHDFNLADTNLRGAYLRRANLSGADLSLADLQGAYLSHATLTQVDFRYAKNLDGIYLYRAILDRTLLPREELSGAVGEERDGHWNAAKEAYLGLKNNWQQLGRYEDANWAYRKERRMEKRASLEQAQEALAKGHRKEAFHSGLKFATDQFVEWLCDYGESLGRVLRALLLVWVCFALLYGLVGGVWGPWRETAAGPMRTSTWNPLHLMAFSLGAMTTSDVVGLEVRRCVAMQVLVPLQAMVGIALTGLLGFVAGNRIRRS